MQLPIRTLSATRRWCVVLLLLIVGLLLANRPVSAHDRVEVDAFVIIVGWQSEPVIVSERNAILLEITLDEQPVDGVEGTLDAEVIYAGATFRSNLNPSDEEGVYLIPILPTVRGQYELRLFGTINDVEIDLIAEPEEVLSAAQLQFPEIAPDTRDVQRELTAEIVALEDSMRSLQLTAYASLAVALISIGVAIVAMVRRQPKS